MRIEGTLAKWNDERGFGFIAPTSGGPEVFVHVSAFPRDGQRPAAGEKVTFEIEVDTNGKKKAKNIICPNRAAPRVVRRPVQRARNEKKGGVSSTIAIAFFVATAAYVYSQFFHHSESKEVTSSSYSASSKEDLSSRFQCDGRLYCQQMTSCAEAKYFLKNCPGVKMDGDNDGIPCEQQWCTSFLSR